MRPVHGGEDPPVLQPYAITNYGTRMMGAYAGAPVLNPGNIDPCRWPVPSGTAQVYYTIPCNPLLKGGASLQGARFVSAE